MAARTKRQGGEPAGEGWLNIPNLISLGRLCIALLLVSTLFFPWLSERDILMLFVIGMISDKVDGFLARKLGKITRLGQQVLEPIADGALLFAALFLVMSRYGFPLWADVYVFIIIVGYFSALTVNHVKNGSFLLDPPMVEKLPVLATYVLMLFWLWRHPYKILLLYIGVLSGIWLLYETWSRVLNIAQQTGKKEKRVFKSPQSSA